MQTEIEAKWLDVDLPSFRKKLLALHATLQYPERFMRRRNFDYPDKRLESIGGWIRVRDEGDIITLSYKQLQDRTLHGTKEITLQVHDFEKTCQFLLAIGLQQTSYQETKREKWILDGNEITLDTWPWIPPFVEIESPDEASLRAAAQTLQLPWSEALHGSVETAYQKYYDVTESEIDNWETITFIPIPGWLAKKRISSDKI